MLIILKLKKGENRSFSFYTRLQYIELIGLVNYH